MLTGAGQKGYHCAAAILAAGDIATGTTQKWLHICQGNCKEILEGREMLRRKGGRYCSTFEPPSSLITVVLQLFSCDLVLQTVTLNKSATAGKKIEHFSEQSPFLGHILCKLCWHWVNKTLGRVQMDHVHYRVNNIKGFST